MKNLLPQKPLIYLIAGEPSGDLLGARLIASLKKLCPDAVFAGVGGPLMEREGLRSLFPYNELTIIGISEIVPHIPRIFYRLRCAFNDIRAKDPDAVITIDSPGFNFRLAERLLAHNATKHIPRIHYVAPTVWAYKEHRAAWTAKLFNHMLLLLPFEPPYFDKVGLPNTYVGHPILWERKPADQGAAFKERHRLPKDAPIICLLPGSRKREVLRLMPIYEQALAILKKKYANLQAVVVAGRQVTGLVNSMAHTSGVPTLIVSEDEKKEAFAASQVALAKSGTVTLEIAMAGVPMVVAYKVSAYSAWALRRLVKIPYFTLVNIIEGEEIIPELLQEKCQPDLLAAKLCALVEDTEIRRTQLEKTHEALVKLGFGQPHSPSDLAAEKILELIK